MFTCIGWHYVIPCGRWCSVALRWVPVEICTCPLTLFNPLCIQWLRGMNRLLYSTECVYVCVCSEYEFRTTARRCHQPLRHVPHMGCTDQWTTNWRLLCFFFYFEPNVAFCVIENFAKHAGWLKIKKFQHTMCNFCSSNIPDSFLNRIVKMHMPQLNYTTTLLRKVMTIRITIF